MPVPPAEILMFRRAFTLIELLVVISILSLLMGLLLPALSAARATAQATRCAAGLHDVGVALQGYFNTNDDRFPLSQAHGGYQPGSAWIDTLAPHTQMKLQYRCPTDHAPNFDEPDPAKRRVTSYGINVFMNPNDPGWTPDNPSGIPSFGFEVATRLAASDLIFVAELAEEDASHQPLYADHFHADMWSTNPFTGYGGADPQFDLALSRHQQKSNYLFVDGHAVPLRFDETFRVSPDGQTLEIDKFDPGFPHGPAGWFQPPA
ncbi:MAG: prepilin-type N-terminal cleavage/methylation domain-containing protein [Phycisphaerae bacterium]